MFEATLDVGMSDGVQHLMDMNSQLKHIRKQYTPQERSYFSFPGDIHIANAILGQNIYFHFYLCEQPYLSQSIFKLHRWTLECVSLK